MLTQTQKTTLKGQGTRGGISALAETDLQAQKNNMTSLANLLIFTGGHNSPSFLYL